MARLFGAYSGVVGEILLFIIEARSEGRGGSSGLSLAPFSAIIPQFAVYCRPHSWFPFMAANANPTHSSHPQSIWLGVMCLTGVDYFSTLGYQPSIAFENAGLLAPLATVILVLVTLLGALPIYSHVASSSPHGQGSIGMLARLVRGWWGKGFVLALLGFAATDFVITKTLSAADAAVHLIDNPFWERFMPSFVLRFSHDQQQIVVTMLLLVFLGAMFLRGFREVIGLAVVIVIFYLALNAIVVGTGIVHLIGHPDRVTHWYEQVVAGDWKLHEAPPFHGTGWLPILAVCLLLFPKLALGLSGFETGVAVMPLVKGDATDTHEQPHGRIRNTRKLLLTAALIMSVFLLGSSLVVSTLIPAEDFAAPVKDATGAILQKPGKAYERALAYLSHADGPEPLSPLFGDAFGTIYDISTIIILWFAGASAMAGLLNLVPQYLPRYGMAPEWARAMRPLVLLFTAINLLVTWLFKASVSAQGAAYATGVLVLMTSGGVASVIDRWRHGTGAWIVRMPWYYLLVTVVFFYTTAANIYEKPDGIKIASWFIVAIVVASVVSRLRRSTELRFERFIFADDQSRFLWDSMRMLEIPVLIPHRPGRRSLDTKEKSIREEHRLGPDVPVVFCEVQVGDPSEFYQEPLMEMQQEGGRFILKITRAASIAHVLAALGLELSKHGRPPEIHFGWSDESSVAANIGFLLFGEGNVPWLVRELIVKNEPNPEKQPRVIIG